jgi:ABC-type glycerol-3-phosphate transport system substrate-binding protein
MRALMVLLCLSLWLTAAANAGEVTVLLPASDNERNMNEIIAAQYMKDHPGTKITFQYVAGSGQTLERAMTMIERESRQT